MGNHSQSLIRLLLSWMIYMGGCSTPPGVGDGNPNDNDASQADVEANDTEYVAYEFDETQPTCEGVAGFAVLLPEGLTMSLYQGSVRITPTVCGGAGPYSYSWTPVENLQDVVGGLGGGPLPEITSADVDFRATAVGEYEVSVMVGDSRVAIGAPGAPSATMRIGVNDSAPLVIDAGEDVAVAEGGYLELEGSAIGGTGAYDYSWEPAAAGPGQAISVDTDTVGEFDYTLTVTDQRSGDSATDSVRVVVLPAGADCTTDYVLPEASANFVAFDADFGSAGQAIILSGTKVYFFDFSNESFRTQTLELPADGRGVAIDSERRRAFVTTQLEGEFTRSVQVIDLDTPALESNIGLTAEVVQARGMAVVPSSGEVVVAVSSGGDADGLMILNPDAGTVDGAIQNVHLSDSFSEPIDVAVLEDAGLAVAVVANAKARVLTLVPLSTITQTPNVSDTAGGPLSQVEIGGIARAIAPVEDQGAVVVGWNSGERGWMQVITLEDAVRATAGPNVTLPAAIVDQGIDVDPDAGVAYVALGKLGAAAVNLEFEIMATSWPLPAGSGWAVAAQTAHGSALIVGSGGTLSERCP
ncbi:MAG: hypothetical protein O7D91_18185 [Planctomycetota bacterium]|nr:hypothetical protein [Planctomycetota bacterium]